MDKEIQNISQIKIGDFIIKVNCGCTGYVVEILLDSIKVLLCNACSDMDKVENYPLICGSPWVAEWYINPDPKKTSRRYVWGSERPSIPKDSRFDKYRFLVPSDWCCGEKAPFRGMALICSKCGKVLGGI